MVKLAEQNCCTGCGACSAICPVQAIVMRENKKDGFYSPYIKNNICVECEKCETICPELHKSKETKSYYVRVFAAVHQDKEKRDAGASGGIFAALADEIIKRGGCVAGVIYDANLNIIHKLMDTEEGIKELFGSKYAQSDMRYVYEEVYQKLADGKEVLFCGTPCQVMGIKQFAKMKKLDEKLITVDLLCRGVPSPKAFHKYLEIVEKKYGKKVTYVKFKDNEKGWHNINTRIIMEDGIECYLPIEECTYLEGFLKDNMIVRNSCFHCSYKTIERQADITIGDFWGLKNTELEDDKGTSLVLLNSAKGAELWDNIKQMLLYKESTMWRVIRGNQMAFERLPENPARNQFWEYLEQHNYDEALKKANHKLSEYKKFEDN